jgi:hypothetical protein
VTQCGAECCAPDADGGLCGLKLGAAMVEKDSPCGTAL